MNVAHMEQLVADIAANEHSVGFTMAVWVRYREMLTPKCGTAACCAGHAVLRKLTDDGMAFNAAYDYLCSLAAIPSLKVPKLVDIATEWLDLQPAYFDSVPLFHHSNWPLHYRLYEDSLSGTAQRLIKDMINGTVVLDTDDEFDGSRMCEAIYNWWKQFTTNMQVGDAFS